MFNALKSPSPLPGIDLLRLLLFGHGIIRKFKNRIHISTLCLIWYVHVLAFMYPPHPPACALVIEYSWSIINAYSYISHELRIPPHTQSALIANTLICCCTAVKVILTIAISFSFLLAKAIYLWYQENMHIYSSNKYA